MNELRGVYREIDPEGRREQRQHIEAIAASLRQGVSEIFQDIESLREGRQEELRARLKERMVELGERPETVDVAIAQVDGIGGSATVEVFEKTPSRQKDTVIKPSSVPGKYGLALTAILFSGCGTGDVSPLPIVKKYKQAHVEASGPRDLGDQYFDPRVEPIPVLEGVNPRDTDCGVKPEAAPPECEIQQWKGYSEINPTATAWMAISNIGDEPCTATITRLELSYKDSKGERHLLTSGVNWAQVLSEGGEYGWWGKETDVPISGSGSRYDIPPHLNAYVHPFSHMVYVPEDATDLALTFSAEITDGCIMQGGTDTYTEYMTPQEGYKKGYTQDGSTTDFIKEALKTKYYERTVEPTEPVSISIQRIPEDSPEYQYFFERRKKVLIEESAKEKMSAYEARQTGMSTLFLEHYLKQMQGLSRRYAKDELSVRCNTRSDPAWADIELDVADIQSFLADESTGYLYNYWLDEHKAEISIFERVGDERQITIKIHGRAFNDFMKLKERVDKEMGE